MDARPKKSRARGAAKTRKAKAKAPALADALAGVPAAGEGGGDANPLDILFTYQSRISLCDDDFIAACFARQTGKSFSVASREARRMIVRRNLTVVIAAPTLRQSLESLEKVKDWLRAFSASFSDFDVEMEDVEKGFYAKGVTLPNGSRCIAVPGRPDTVRGFSGDIWLDEFAFFDEPDATWRAIIPSITNPLKGGKKSVVITSTPNGKGKRGRRFYNIMHHFTKGRWTTFTVTLKDAIADGLPVDYDELADLLDDPIAQAQELDCKFLDDTNELLTYDLIAGATSPEASSVADSDFWETASGKDLRLGIDFGRTNDPTVCWTLERVGDVWVTREVLVMRNASAPEQEELLARRLSVANRVCFDYTGPGIGTGDHLAKDYGLWKPANHEFGKIELCTFTTAFKRELFPKLRRAFEAPVTVRIPAGDDIRDDLHAMQMLVNNGEYTYSAPHTAEGHSDRCTALALALRATAGAVVREMPVPVKVATAAREQFYHERKTNFWGQEEAPQTRERSTRPARYNRRPRHNRF